LRYRERERERESHFLFLLFFFVTTKRTYITGFQFWKIQMKTKKCISQAITEAGSITNLGDGR